MVKPSVVFSRLGAAKVLVIGDFILDSYTIGKVRRISPEAPVPVVNVKHEEHRAGGAGNVILNLISMGAQVVPVGRIGNDPAAAKLKEIFASEGLSLDGLFVEQGYPTPVKNRIIADGQQIVRIDCEKATSLSKVLEQTIIKSLPKLLVGVSVVAILDYGKGFLTPSLLKVLIEEAKKLNIVVIADPKGVDFSKYSGATILKPNLSEAYASVNMPPETCLNIVAEKVLKVSQAETLLVTRSEEGLSIFHRNGSREDHPVRIREVKDVTGAGDTVLAMLAYSMANKLSLSEAAQLSNLAAGVAIERFGCARVALSDVARYLLEIDNDNKIFDPNHLFALQHAVKGRNTALVSLSCNQGLTSPILKHLIRLGNRKEIDLLVNLQDVPKDDAFIDILKSFKDIDYILLSGKSAKEITEEISFAEVYTFVDDDLVKSENLVDVNLPLARSENLGNAKALAVELI
ncbi:MAG: HldE protein [Parachlamydiaceae bacterium]|nr:HldE protein [Parachlamydiaceae bacterium]